MTFPTLKSVNLSRDAFLVCASHALLTEQEEIMGLLLGDIENDEATIWGVSVLVRSDKRPDRVEISPEQLAMAADEAASLGQAIGRHTRVVGWYHSHPRITVQPSHVDLRTQSMYQQLDRGFVGLIFSVFNQEKDAGRLGKLQLIAFQSVAYEAAERRRSEMREQENERKRLEKEAELARAPMKQFSLDVPSGLFSSLAVSVRIAQTPAAPLPELSAFGGFSSAAFLPIEATRPEHEQVDIPVAITAPIPGAPNLLHKVVELQQILFDEAQAAYRDAMKAAGERHPLGVLHHQAVYQKALCRLLEFGIAPIMEMLTDRQAERALMMRNVK